jgi:hypothetical protein
MDKVKKTGFTVMTIIQTSKATTVCPSEKLELRKQNVASSKARNVALNV